MKNTVYQGLAFLAMMLSLAACQKSGPASNETGENGASVSKKRISITATIPETITKVAMTQEDNGSGKPTGPVSLAWETGDKITISNGPDTEVFELKSIEGTKAIFEGNEITGSSFTITYSKLPDFKSQSQPGNASTKGLGWEGKLSGVNAITDFTFSSEWANENGGGTFTQSSILRLRAKLPSGVASTVNGVTIKAFDVATGEKVNLIDDDIPQIAVTIAEPGAGAETDVVTVYATMPAEDITVPSGKALLFSFSSTNANHSVYTHYRPVTSPITIAQGTVTPLNINCPEVATYANANNTDIGTASNPYLIGDAYQLQALNAIMASKSAGTRVYAELVDDIDLQVYSNWSPIDASTRYIHLDGRNNEVKNMTITSGTYCGLFGVLYGTVKNLTITDASVSGVTKASGILTGYICANTGLSEGCTIDNVVINRASLNGGSQYCGAIAGLIGKHVSNTFAVKISNVEITGLTVTSSQTCGGLLGYTQSESSANRSLTIAGVDIIDSSVETTGASKYVGGLIGVVDDANATISGISVKGTNVSGLTKADAVGGIIGQVTAAADFDGCTYEKSDTETATVTGPTQHDGTDGATPTGGYIGGIAGEVSGDASFDDCHVKNATITFTKPSDNTGYWKYTGGAFGYLHASGAKIGDTAACSVETVSVTAYHYCGGFVAFMDGGSIKQSTVSALTISGQNYVGGFVGQLNTGSVTGCSVSGNAMKANATVAGFVGRCDGGTLEGNTTSLPLGTTATKVGTNVGGFVGYIEGSPSFNNCNANGNIYASGGGIGGFAGTVNTGTPTFSNNCYATGSVSSSGNSIGGFVGNDAAGGNYTSCYSSGVVSGNQSVGGFIGKAKAATFEGCSYRGTAVTGAITTSNAQVGGFCGHTETTACSFTSCYVYNATSGTKVEGATQRVGGFIGQLALAGDNISKCYVKNVSVSGTGNHYGGFCGVQYGPIEKSFVDGGTVTAGGDNVGGFSGYQEKAALTNCYSTATVVGGSRANVGGITGQLRNQNTSKITNCYYAGTLTGTGTRGGIVGLAAGTNCTVTGCISWDSSLAVCGSSGTLSNNYVKAASETGTVSSHAQESPRSWSSSIWDFNSGDLPKLIGVN